MPEETLIVTGSSGLIGSRLIHRVGEAYMEIGLDREGPPDPPPSTEVVVPCDVTSDDSVTDAMSLIRKQGCERIASVVHLAAYYDFSGKPSPLYDEVTVNGTRRLLNGLRGFEVEQFIFSSTMLVHRPAPPEEAEITEDSPLEAKWDYPESKIKTEELLRRERGNVPVVFLRIAGVYDEDCNSIPIANQIQRIQEKRLTGRVYPGDPERGQAFVHVDDVVDSIVKVIEQRHSLPPEAEFLIGEEETISYKELQRIIGEELHGEEWKTFQIPKPIAKMGAWAQDVMPGMDPFIKPWMIDLADDHYDIETKRARDLLGWVPKHSLRRVLPEILRRMKADPEAWYEKNGLK